MIMIILYFLVDTLRSEGQLKGLTEQKSSDKVGYVSLIFCVKPYTTVYGRYIGKKICAAA